MFALFCSYIGKYVLCENKRSAWDHTAVGCMMSPERSAAGGETVNGIILHK